MTEVAPAPAKPARSSTVGAGLSFLWPGLGQWYLGRAHSALVYAAPMALIAVLLIGQLAAGFTTFGVRLLDPGFSLPLLVLVVLTGGWRMLAIVDAALRRRAGARFGRRPVAIVAALLALVVGTHGLAAYYTYAFYQAGSTIFVVDDPGPTEPPPTEPGGSSPTPTDDVVVPPTATPAPERDRITILLTGIDKSTERTTSLTDTLLVVSLDPETGAVAMVSFPRDIAEFPLSDGRTFYGRINSLMSYAANHPRRFPDGPLPSLAKELGFLLGIPVDYYAAVDLDGFQLLIDAVGGVTVEVERAIADPRYNWLDGSPRGFYLDIGRQKLDGRTALAFVRSRYGAGDNDFTRSDRQQQLLLALRTKLTKPEHLDKLPAVLDAAAKTVRSNFPPERLAEILELAQLDGGGVRRVVLQPPRYSVHPPTNTTGGTYILRIKWDAIRALSVRLFAEDSAFWTGEFDTAGSPIPIPAP